MKKTRELDLRLLALALLRKLWLIVLCAAILGTGAFVYTKGFVDKMYTSSVTLYVYNSREDKDGNQITMSASDLSVAQRLVNTYVITIKSDKVLTEVADNLNVDPSVAKLLESKLTAGQIRGMISAEAIDNTEVFKVQVTNKNPELAKEIANEIARVAPDKLADIMPTSELKIVDDAKKGSLTSPNVTRNVILGAAIGAALAVVIAILQELMDVRVREEQDVTRISNAPILGRIPDFSMDDKGDAYADAQKAKQEGKAVEK